MFEKERTVISWFRKILFFSHNQRLPMWNKLRYDDQSLCIYRGTWPRLVGKRQSDLHSTRFRKKRSLPIFAQVKRVTSQCVDVWVWGTPCRCGRDGKSLSSFWSNKGHSMSAGDHQVVVCLKKRKSTEEPTNQTRFFQHSSFFFFNHRSFPTLNNQNSHCTWPIEACVETFGRSGSQRDWCWEKSKQFWNAALTWNLFSLFSNEPKANPDDWLSLPSFIFVKLWDWTCDYHCHYPLCISRLAFVQRLPWLCGNAWCKEAGELRSISGNLCKIACHSVSKCVHVVMSKLEVPQRLAHLYFFQDDFVDDSEKQWLPGKSVRFLVTSHKPARGFKESFFWRVAPNPSHVMLLGHF